MKSVIVTLRRFSKHHHRDECELETEDWLTPDFCWEKFRVFGPVLCRGLRKGQKRKLKLTQTKKGIKLERL